MSRDEKGDEVKDRLAGRFDDSDNTDSTDNSSNLDNTDDLDNIEKSEKPDDSDNLDNTDGQDNQEQSSQRDVINPKEEWIGRMVYVPDGDDTGGEVENLLDGFDGEYDRLQYECDWDIRKQLHYYPVLIQYGVEKIEEMDGDEFSRAVKELGLQTD